MAKHMFFKAIGHKYNGALAHYTQFSSYASEEKDKALWMRNVF